MPQITSPIMRDGRPVAKVVPAVGGFEIIRYGRSGQVNCGRVFTTAELQAIRAKVDAHEGPLTWDGFWKPLVKRKVIL